MRGELYGLTLRYAPHMHTLLYLPWQVRGEVYGLAHVAERFSSRSALRALHPQTCRALPLTLTLTLILVDVRAHPPPHRV